MIKDLEEIFRERDNRNGRKSYRLPLLYFACFGNRERAPRDFFESMTQERRFAIYFHAAQMSA